MIYLTLAQLEDPAMVTMAEAAAKDLGTTLMREGVGQPYGPRLAESGIYVMDIKVDGVDNAFTPSASADSVHISLSDSDNETKLKAARWAARLGNKPLVVDPAKGVDAVSTLDLADRGVHISDADSRDSVKYRRAKAIAESKGQSLVIDSPIPDAFVRDPSAIAVPKSASSAQYRAAKAEAERTGKSIQIVDG